MISHGKTRGLQTVMLNDVSSLLCSKPAVSWVTGASSYAPHSFFRLYRRPFSFGQLSQYSITEQGREEAQLLEPA